MCTCIRCVCTCIRCRCTKTTKNTHAQFILKQINSQQSWVHLSTGHTSHSLYGVSNAMHYNVAASSSIQHTSSTINIDSRSDNLSKVCTNSPSTPPAHNSTQGPQNLQFSTNHPSLTQCLIKAHPVFSPFGAHQMERVELTRRAVLQTAVAALCVETGYLSVEKHALGSLTEATQSCQWSLRDLCSKISANIIIASCNL